MSSDFGVIIACHRHDYYLAKACCASIRYFMDDVPIALLTDGEFSTRDMEYTYGVTTLRRGAVSDPDLRARSFGWGLTKMIAFWNSPWSTFLLVDADTVVWGDLRKYARFGAIDVVVDRHIEELFPLSRQEALLNRFLGRHRLAHEPELREHVERWYFQAEHLHRRDPAFPLGESIDRLFCSGAILARRNAVDRDAYLAVLDSAQSIPGLFGPGEMGLLNYLFFKAEAAGNLRIRQEAGLQTMVHMIEDTAMKNRFPMTKEGPPGAIGRPSVLHWSGWRKPVIRDQQPKAAPMNFFRYRFLFDSGYSRSQATAILAAEDYNRLVRFAVGALSDNWISRWQHATTGPRARKFGI